MPRAPHEQTIAVVGATGAVGQEFLHLIGERAFPHRELRLFASERSAGREVPVCGRGHRIEALREGCFDGVDIAFFSAGKGISLAWAPRAVAAGAWAVDNSSAFRMRPDVPLVVPEVNGHVLRGLAAPCIVAVPNCSTIIALVAVTPIHRAVGVARMVVATYQAASGAGAQAMAELENQAREFAAGRPLTTTVFGRPYLFNLFSHNSAVGADGMNEEERKLVQETHKIWGDATVGIAATCVRVPVLRSHCEAINLTLRAPLSEDAARALLAAAPGVEVVDDRAANRFPEPILASGRNPVLVGRIRADASQPAGLGLQMFVAGDQIRKGAALTGIEIAERLAGRAEAGASVRVPGVARGAGV
jgi:aspartate-semialdehyde dehydrogenase